MKALDLTALALVIIGGLNWGLVGLFDFDLVTAIFGQGAAESAEASWLSRIVYIVVALSALWLIKVFADLASDRRTTATTTTR